MVLVAIDRARKSSTQLGICWCGHFGKTSGPKWVVRAPHLFALVPAPSLLAAQTFAGLAIIQSQLPHVLFCLSPSEILSSG